MVGPGEEFDGGEEPVWELNATSGQITHPAQCTRANTYKVVDGADPVSMVVDEESGTESGEENELEAVESVVEFEDMYWWERWWLKELEAAKCRYIGQWKVG